MLTFFTYLRTQIKAWQDSRFLKKHGCENWQQYHRWYDPDISPRSSRVRDFYRGYPYLYCFESRQHDVYSWNLDCDGRRTAVGRWCDEHCSDKHRMDMFRVIKCPATSNEWEMNDLGGGDYIFAAFKNERDFLMFTLRWA